MYRSFTTPEWLRITRPIQCITVLMGTWVSAVVLGDQQPFSTQAIAVSIAMGLLSLAASLFHAGHTSPSAPCARKFVDTPSTGNRRVILLFAGFAFMGCFFTAARFLAFLQVMIIIMTAGMLVIYCMEAGTSNHWLNRNMLFGLIATMPISIGSMNTRIQSPEVINGAYLPVFLMIFMLYFIRETIKTIYEERAGGAHQEMPVNCVDRTVFVGHLGGTQLVLVCTGLAFYMLITMFASIRASGANFSLIGLLPFLCMVGLIVALVFTVAEKKMLPHLQRVVTACVWLTAASLVAGKMM